MNGFNIFKLGTQSQEERGIIESLASDTYYPSDIIVPSLADIWYNSDTTEPSLNFPVGINSGYPYYSAPVERDYSNMTVVATDPWYTTAEETAGGSCTLTISTATNTAIELGAIYSWWLMSDNTWQLATNTKLRYNGASFPNSGDPFAENLGCDSGAVYDERVANINYEPYITLSADGYGRCVPKHAYWDHGWQPIISIPNSAKGQFIQQYVRLTLIDPDGVDDRHLARFVHCVGADSRELDGTVYGDVGIGRWLRVSNNWISCTMLTGGHFTDFADFSSNPPPIAQTPS